MALLATASAQQGTASINGNSRSLYFGPMSHFEPGIGTVATYLTTYDGTNAFPLYQPVGQSALFSGELRPWVGQPGYYQADYVTYTPSGVREYGSFLTAFPTTDSDGNGLPDICQSNKAVNIATTGSLNIDWPFQTVDSFTLYVVRSANQLSGTYTLDQVSNGSRNVGSVQLLNIGGSVSYNRGSSTISFDFGINDPLAGGTRTVSGSTSYTVTSANQIVLPQFSVTGGGATYTFQGGCTLNRQGGTGSRYIGNATLTDGMPETYWGDAIDWVIEINDPNDWDANGIPNISDTAALFPFIVTQPQSKTAVVASNTSFTVEANGSMPLSYRWQFNNANITGGSNATLVITNVQFSHQGNYRVIVSNGGGAVTSQVAVLTVVFPPNITDQPVNQTVIAGQSAQFNVGANGTDPLSYQWRHAGTNLPGATQPIFVVDNAQPKNEGSYTVVVSNYVGLAISSSALLTVLVPPAISVQPESLSVPTNANATFSVTATGTAPTYRWMRNGTNIPSATGPILNLNSVRPESSGVFSVVVSNVAGRVVSSNAVLYVGLPLTVTNFVRQPSGLVRLDLLGSPGSNYTLETSINLTNWTSMATNSAVRGIIRFTNSPAPAPTPRFYRGKLEK